MHVVQQHSTALFAVGNLIQDLLLDADVCIALFLALEQPYMGVFRLVFPCIPNFNTMQVIIIDIIADLIIFQSSSQDPSGCPRR